MVLLRYSTGSTKWHVSFTAADMDMMGCSTGLLYDNKLAYMDFVHNLEFTIVKNL
jgi:hypothetical protein